MKYSHSETDYRKIPRSQLETNIPQGRGMVKWAPFATLPEQFERLHQYVTDQTKVERPVLSEDQIHDLNQKIDIAFNKGCPIQVRYFKEGRILIMNMLPKKIDYLEQFLIGNELKTKRNVKLSLLDITQISLIRL
ncbi:YolD-like family protein [Staphylococcus condimenti]|uniref:YolD-like family protein n=1 Tax=Staphylococcus condimenti TaxID=70255 RepID=A0A3S4TP20_9STAP|nr:MULTISPECIES: YolD-like family protein [Staphylococcus]MDK8645542.1 YolD-like family protein [Staphylococcus condimenti]PNZ60681.1 YolD-like family protein [Staphylococcus condimenti]QQS83817.1 YolD-like family protein [Staphylococcus condimenti]QRP96136.1 YolD-like family protein [Staphylococcus condimenti]RZI00305.1 YolD-like family protein [Staphylococcus condimenti]